MEKIAQQHVEHVSSVDVDAVYEFTIRCSSLDPEAVAQSVDGWLKGF